MHAFKMVPFWVLGPLCVLLSLIYPYGAAIPTPTPDDATDPPDPLMIPTNDAFIMLGPLLFAGWPLNIILLLALIIDNPTGQKITQERFVGALLANVTATFPNFNVLIYHDQAGVFWANKYTHQHFEVPMSCCKTYGYELLIFDYGNFTRAGDGGFNNWGYNGNYIRTPPEGTTVFFYPMGAPIPGDSPPHERATTAHESIDTYPRMLPPASTVPPNTPTRENSASTDGYYFVDCTDGPGLNGSVSSGIAYYKNFELGQNVGQQPDDYANIAFGNWDLHGAALFKNGSTLKWDMFGNAIEANVNSTTGMATSGTESSWIYRDAGVQLYSTDDSSCRSLYWTF